MISIELECNKTMQTISGSDNGILYARKQILPKINKIKLKVVIKIPDYIIFVGGSFMSGIFRELGRVYSREQIRKYIKVESADETVRKDFGEQWTINL